MAALNSPWRRWARRASASNLTPNQAYATALIQAGQADSPEDGLRQIKGKPERWLKRRTPRSKAEGERALFQFIEGWHNPWRRHGALGRPATPELTDSPRAAAPLRCALGRPSEDPIPASR